MAIFFTTKRITINYISEPSNLLLDKMKSTNAFNTRVLVTKPTSPWRRSLTTLAPQEAKISLFILETVFKRTDLSFVKLGQWSK